LQKRERNHGTEKGGRKPKGSLIKELDAAIALLTHTRSLAVAATESEKTKRQSTKHGSKRTLSQEGHEAIAAAQRKRWAKGKRQKRLAE
jgi:hypothetical protein